MVAFNFQPCFSPKIITGEKPSTIRSKMRCKIGGRVQLFEGQRTKDCRLLATGVCIGLAEIIINRKSPHWEIPGFIGIIQPNNQRIHTQEGFASVGRMVDFFEQRYDLPYRGYMHVWELD